MTVSEAVLIKYVAERVPLEKMATVIDIAQVIGAVVDLQERSDGHYCGLCPFCDDGLGRLFVGPTPHCAVKIGFWCFRCNSAGTVIKFIEKMILKVGAASDAKILEAGLRR